MMQRLFVVIVLRRNFLLQRIVLARWLVKAHQYDLLSIPNRGASVVVHSLVCTQIGI